MIALRPILTTVQCGLKRTGKSSTVQSLLDGNLIPTGDEEPLLVNSSTWMSTESVKLLTVWAQRFGCLAVPPCGEPVREMNTPSRHTWLNSQARTSPTTEKPGMSRLRK